MIENVIICENNQAPISQALKKYFDIENYENDNELQFSQRQDPSKSVAFLMDFQNKIEKNYEKDAIKIKRSLALGAPVILCGVKNNDYMAKLFGLGFKTQATIIYPSPAGKAAVFDILDHRAIMRDRGEYELVANAKDAKVKTIRKSEAFDQGSLTTTMIADMNEEEIASLIKNGLKSTAEANTQIKAMVAENGGITGNDKLPEHQLYTALINMPFSGSLDGGQDYSNAVSWHIELVADYSSEKKIEAGRYLQITSMGVGFHPGGLLKNDNNNRGWWQDRINLSMRPVAEDKFILFDHSPKSANKATTITTSTSFSAGIDIGKDPKFSSSATIGENETETIMDFDVKNDSKGVEGSWIYQMGLTNGDPNGAFYESISDLFHGRINTIKELPALATGNLAPRVTTIWYIDAEKERSGTETIATNIDVQYIKAWTATLNYRWRRTTISKFFPLTIDLGKVNAP